MTIKPTSLDVRPSGFEIYIDNELKGSVFKQDREITVDDVMTYEEFILFVDAVNTIMERECEMTFKDKR